MFSNGQEQKASSAAALIARLYLAGILEVFHRPAFMRAGNSTPVAARSWAIPVRNRV